MDMDVNLRNNYGVENLSQAIYSSKGPSTTTSSHQTSVN